MLAPIMVLVVAVTVATCAALAAATGTFRLLPGTPTAGSAPIDRDGESQFFELEAMTTAPEKWWTVDVTDTGLSAYPSYTATVAGDPLIYLTNNDNHDGPGQLVLLNSFTGQRKWTANLDHPTSCTQATHGQFVPCEDYAGNQSRVRYVDLHTGEVTSWLSAERKIARVTAANEAGTEFLVAVEGPGRGEVTVHRGTPTNMSSVWSATFRVENPSSNLYVDHERQTGNVGYGPNPGDSATFDVTTGRPVPDESEPYDPNVWTWAGRIEVRVDPIRRTFEIVDATGRVIARGTNPGNHTGKTRLIGEEYKSVILVGDSAYDTSSGAKLWTDSRLMSAERNPLSSINSPVAAIVGNTVVLEFRDDFPAGSLVGIDLRTGRQLWQRDYRSAPVQRFVDDERWVSILDGRLQSFDIRTGHEVWSVAYPGAVPSDSHDEESLYKIDGRHVVVSTEQTVSLFGPE